VNKSGNPAFSGLIPGNNSGFKLLFIVPDICNFRKMIFFFVHKVAHGYKQNLLKNKVFQSNSINSM